MIQVHPYRDKISLSSRIKELNPEKVLLLFMHGLGDFMMFRAPYEQLKKFFPNVIFNVGSDEDTGVHLVFEDVIPLKSYNLEENPIMFNYDLVADIDFPMNEYLDVNVTKSELCCLMELGISKTSEHMPLKKFDSKLVGIHFNCTALPGQGASEEEAASIWQDVIDAGWCPLEVSFEHCYHNPINVKFPFVDATLRKCVPKLSSLFGVIQSCGAFIGGTSGPFHVALSSLNPNKIMYLERDFPKERYTTLPIKSVKLDRYNHEVKEWLNTL